MYLQKQNKSIIKLIKIQQKNVFLFFKFLPKILYNRKLLLFIWSFRVSYINLISYSKYFSLFINFLKFLVVRNNPYLSQLFILDKKFIESKLLITFFFKLNFFLKLFLKQGLVGWYYILNFIGLGYKVFLYKNFLYLKLGFCRIIRVNIPNNISIFCRKKSRILLFSEKFDILSAFINNLKRLRKFDLYKGKGIFEYTNFDGIKLKVGKQQQFY